MTNNGRGLSGIGGILLLMAPVVVVAGAQARPITSDTLVQEAQEAGSATKDYTIQQKEAFKRKVQSELDGVQTRITQLREQVRYTSAEGRADLQLAIRELEKKKDLAENKLQAIQSATVSSWEQAKARTTIAMDDLRESLTRTLSHFPSR